MASVVGSIIQEHLGWPNAHFMPDDPCALLLASSASGLQDVCAILAICNRYGITPEELGSVNELQFEGLINRIRELSQKAEGSGEHDSLRSGSGPANEFDEAGD
jgi:hypothetical protein